MKIKKLLNVSMKRQRKQKAEQQTTTKTHKDDW